MKSDTSKTAALIVTTGLSQFSGVTALLPEVSANEAEKANAFIRWIKDTNTKMVLPGKFE